MKRTMRGLVKESAGPGDFVYRDDLPIPEIADDEVLFKVHCTAICKTDLHIMDWDKWTELRARPPFIPGHETSGDVVAVGSNVKNIKIGDRISCETHITCGKCWYCTHGMSHMCSSIKLFGVMVDGAFAEYAKVHERTAYVLNDETTYEEACLFEPMGAGVHGVEAAEVKGRNVLVSGCGPIGLTAVSAAKYFGAGQVFACDLVDERLEQARIMGADYVFNSGECDLPSEIRKLTDGLGADAAIEVTGVQPGIVNAVKSVRNAGKVVCVGLPVKDITLDLTNDVIYREVILTGISGRKIWDTWDDFTKVMHSKYYHLDQLMGKSYKLEDYREAFEASRNGASGKIILYP